MFGSLEIGDMNPHEDLVQTEIFLAEAYGFAEEFDKANSVLSKLLTIHMEIFDAKTSPEQGTDLDPDRREDLITTIKTIYQMQATNA
jgi:hypothetical protein